MKKVILLLALFTSISGFSQIPGWTHSQPITVLEHSGTALTNYQVKITVNTQTLISNGEMLSNGNDIRFSTGCNGGNILSYWIESGINTPATDIWVKIDSIPANGGKTIYLNYGNTSASAQSAINGTFSGPHSATDSISGGSNGGVTDSQRGIRFKANEDLLVTSFGKNEPNGSTRYITLFDNATQAILRQEQISGPAGQYSYQPLTNPIWLTGGNQYIIEMHQGSSDGYYFGVTTTQIGQHLTYYDMRYCNGCDQNTFPQNYLNDIHYGYPDFWYYTKAHVSPAPTYQFGSYLTAMPDEQMICLHDSATIPLLTLGGEAPFHYQWTGGFISNDTIQQPIVSPTDTLEYHVSITDACGFSKTDSITINVSALPVANLQASSTILCAGEWAELTVTPGYDVLWDDNSTEDSLVVSPSATTTYHVQTTNTNGCHSYDSIQVVFHVPAFATHQITKCYGENYQIGNHTYTLNGTYIDTLSGISSCDSIITTVLNFQGDIDAEIQQVGLNLVADLGGDSYQWVNCATGNTPIPGATGSYYEATQNGTYAALVTVGACTKLTNCISITTVGLEELGQIENLSLFPNPTSGVLTIQSSSTQELKVINPVGSIVYTIRVTAGESKQLDLTALGAGSYYLQSRTKVIRFVIQ